MHWTFHPVLNPVAWWKGQTQGRLKFERSLIIFIPWRSLFDQCSNKTKSTINLFCILNPGTLKMVFYIAFPTSGNNTNFFGFVLVKLNPDPWGAKITNAPLSLALIIFFFFFFFFWRKLNKKIVKERTQLKEILSSFC